MGILLLAGAALQRGLQGRQDVDLAGIEDARGGSIVGAGEHELHGGGRPHERDHGELFERGAVLDDALLDAAARVGNKLPPPASERLRQARVKSCVCRSGSRAHFS